MFAEAFYGSLLRGNRFITAVGEARTAAYCTKTPARTPGPPISATAIPIGSSARRRRMPTGRPRAPTEDFSGIASATSLKLALERIIVEIRFQGANRAARLESLRKLDAKFGAGWGQSGDVAELFGEAFAEAGDVEASVKWYETAVAAPDGRASMKAAEQLGNIRSRLGWEIVDEAARHLDAMKRREPRGTSDAEGEA